jgi:predicted CXXCH cytochrome family protein
MEILLRYLRQSPSGVVEFLDTAARADAISIGSAADSLVELLGRSVGSRHAEIRQTNAGLRITCRGGHRVDVNGQRCAAKTLQIGDAIGIGSHRLAVIAPPAGFDVAIEIRPDTSVGSSEFEAAFVTDLDRTWLSKRKAAWVLLLVTLLFGLAIPLSVIVLHWGGHPTPRMLPDDALWTSGPLSAAHAHAAGQQCSACHRQLFVHVRDQECTACHETTRDHVSKEHRALTHLEPAQRCGECHAEHLGDAARLAIENDGLCVGCHAASDTTFGTLKVQKVSGFQPDRHPAFSVALQKMMSESPQGAGGDSGWTTYRTPLAGAKEQSNLKFSHTQHLDASKVTRNSDNAALGCADCHVLAADGQHFKPITMQQSCSSCHQLNFDPSAPNRQLPHGKPLDAMLMIEDYFARKFSDPAPAPTRMPERRLPDLERDPSRHTEVDNCAGSTVICARQRAAREIENQFNGRGCVSCHVVTDTKSADIHERFLVNPVRLGYDYFPEARFPHDSHAIQGKLTGDAACEACHAARKSQSAVELLLPNVDQCLKCHRDRAGADAAPIVAHEKEAPKIVPLQCISCHAYHPTALLVSAHLTEE